MKNLLLILLATLFVACSEGTRYDEPEAPVITNSVFYNDPPQTSIDTVKVDSVDKVIHYKKTYKVAKYGYKAEEAVALNKAVGFSFIDVPIADILANPDFVEVSKISIYKSEYYRPRSILSEPGYGSHRKEEVSSYKIQEDSTLRVNFSFWYVGQHNFDVTVVYGIKVKVPITQSLTNYRY